MRRSGVRFPEATPFLLVRKIFHGQGSSRRLTHRRVPVTDRPGPPPIRNQPPGLTDRAGTPEGAEPVPRDSRTPEHPALIRNTSKRPGSALRLHGHRSEPNHYEHAVPVADVRRRLSLLP